MNDVHITIETFDYRLRQMADNILKDFDPFKSYYIFTANPGGIPVAYALRKFLPNSKLTSDIDKADIIVTHIVKNKKIFKYFDNLTSTPFYTVIDSTNNYDDFNYIFPWENNNQNLNI